MILLLPGLIVWLLLLLAGAVAGGALIVGFFASLPFGATAFATLSSLGGSSPLIYTLFAIGIIVGAAARRDVLADLGRVFTYYGAAWLVCALAVYVAAGSYLLPRLFAGQTIAFIPIEGVVTEVPLGPASGNITQTAYFLLGVLLFLAFCMVLLRRENLAVVRAGFFAFVIAQAGLGWIDLGGKLSGAGDVLEIVRTASYALLTDVQESGFMRIVGGCSEASGFAAFGLATLAFAFTYWRETGSKLALLLTVANLILVLLSTSSTAYVGLAALAALMLYSVAKAALFNRLKVQDVLLLAGALAILAAILGLYLYDSRMFAPFTDLIYAMVFEKASSSSGQERSYWNMRSLQSFIETYGLGVGMGSSRSSSWVVSTLAQLGFIGALMMAVLMGYLLRGMGGLRPLPGEQPLFALCAGARASAVAFLLAGSIAGGTADPGVLFFASLATVLACRHHVLAARRRHSQLGHPLPLIALMTRRAARRHAMAVAA
jgi:hypothetical protein